MKGTHHSYCFIQKQSRWNTRTGQLRSCMPWRKPETVFSSYDDVKMVLTDEKNFGTGFPERVKELVSGPG